MKRVTIGEAIRLEREERGWSVEEADLAAGFVWHEGGFADLERWTDMHGFPADDLLALRRIGLDPIGRMVREEGSERRRTLLAPDAPWRKDPRGAAEAVTGWTWSSECPPMHFGPASEPPEHPRWILSMGDGSWGLFSSLDDDADLIRAEPYGATLYVAPSTALVEAVIRGDVTLPPECPGLRTLEGMQ